MPGNTTASAGVASRYATALFDLAKDEGQLDSVAQDMDALESLVAEDADFQRFITNPVVSRNAQGQAIEAAAKQASLQPLTTKFLGVLASQRRLFALPAISRAYRAALAEERGELKAEVTSAAELSGEQLDALKAAIGKFAGQAVNVETRVDPSLIGGLVVQVGSRMLDASLKTKLAKLEQSMRGLN